MFDGKITLNADDLTSDEIQYLTEYKQDLNERIAEETEKRQKELEATRRKRNSKNSSTDFRQVFSYLGNKGGVK